MQQLLTSKVVAEYVPIIERQADDLLGHLSSSVGSLGEIEPILDIYIVELALNLLFGTQYSHRNEAVDMLPLIKQVERSMQHLEYSITEVMPYLWILLSRAKRNAQRLRLQMVNKFCDILRRAHPRDVRLLALSQQSGLDETEVALLAAAFVIGAHVSTVPILHSCIGALSTHPDIRHRARSDIDKIAGDLVKADVDDEERLRFISGIIKESLRCQPPFVHMPHVVSESFVYRDMTIRKGAAIILNAWPINNNPRDFPDPQDFEPIRYSILSTSDRQIDVINRHFWAFGSGHRVCPAVLLSHRILYLTITRILWAFHIERVTEKPIYQPRDMIGFRFRYPSQSRKDLCSSTDYQKFESEPSTASPSDNGRWRTDDSQRRDSHTVIRRIRDV